MHSGKQLVLGWTVSVRGSNKCLRSVSLAVLQHKIKVMFLKWQKYTYAAICRRFPSIVWSFCLSLIAVKNSFYIFLFDNLFKIFHLLFHQNLMCHFHLKWTHPATLYVTSSYVQMQQQMFSFNLSDLENHLMRVKKNFSPYFQGCLDFSIRMIFLLQYLSCS